MKVMLVKIKGLGIAAPIQRKRFGDYYHETLRSCGRIRKYLA